MSVEAAGNMIVVKCMTGMAQAVCASMDTLHFPDFIGTLAGEDTILIICKTDEIAEEKQNELRKLIGGVCYADAALHSEYRRHRAGVYRF